MDLGLKGATAFVTGASAGLGFASADALAAEGCRVAICSRDRGRIDEAAKQIGRHGSEVVPLVCDVTDEVQIRQSMAQLAEAFEGSLNVLVTNARGPVSGFIDDFDADDWRHALDLNLMSTINVTRHALPLVRKAAATPNGFGRVLMIASLVAKQPAPNLYLSNVSRAGVLGFSKTLSEELGPKGITVNALLPGFTKTERLSELADQTNAQTGQSVEEVYEGWAAATALRRLGEPEEFGATVAFLSGRSAAYITGQALLIDGGRIKTVV